MATRLGARADRLKGLRALRGPKGRRERHRFLFEGPTLLDEALRSGVTIEELYVTAAAYASNEAVRALDAAGMPTFLLDERSAAGLSEVESPTGILAVAAVRRFDGPQLFDRDGLVLVLADVNDPANAGTLLRSAEAFGASGVAFGDRGVDPFHSKVVRAAMGSLFRLRVGRIVPADLGEAGGNGFRIAGLRAAGDDLRRMAWPARTALVVGSERRGLGRWEQACEQFLGIPMGGPTESLNAAIAGSIALYEATRNRAETAMREPCQDSVSAQKSQDYRG